jgi:type IV pilus assembly protein PilA
MRVQSKKGSAAGFTPKVHKQTESGLSAIEPLLISETQEDDMDRKQKGFSLIELLIVVAIILIIAAIAIPNLLRARMAANEASAVGSVRTLNTSAVTYASTWGVQFPASMAAMAGALLAGATAAATAKSGYFFTYVGGTATPAVGGCTGFQTYTVVGRPANVGQSGQRGFFSDQSGVIRYTTDGSAPTIASPPLQ